MIFQLAWRNIWRNPRRTFVILTAIVIGVWSMIFLGSLMRGMEVSMIKNGVSTLTGDVAIHQIKYRNDPIIANRIENIGQIEKILPGILPPGSRYTGRIRVNASCSNARHSVGVELVGIDPEKEKQVSFIGKAMDQGKYLSADDKYGIVVGRALVEKLETKIGHKLVLMCQDTTGQITSRAFRIKGTFKSDMESTEKRFVFVSLFAARHMVKAGDAVSEISIVLGNGAKKEGTDGRMAKLVKQKLIREFTKIGVNTLEVTTWQDTLPMLKAYLKIFDSFIYIWYVVVFIAMGFGIVNTTLMAVFERMREFGLIKALGMKPAWIIWQVVCETVYILIIGILLGNGLGLSCVYLLGQTGIDLSSFAQGVELAGMSRMIYPILWMDDIWIANLVVIGLGLLVSIYPAVKAARFTPIEALAHT